MRKEQFINKIEQAWAAFQDSYVGLTDEQMMEPGITGDWSVRDILAHVTWWEAEALKHLPLILQGGRPPRYADLYGGIDAFNAQMTERKRRQKLSEVRYQHEKTHTRLLEYLQSAPEDQFISETRFRHRLRLDTYSHYPIHTQAILDWRNKK